MGSKLCVSCSVLLAVGVVCACGVVVVAIVVDLMLFPTTECVSLKSVSL